MSIHDSEVIKFKVLFLVGFVFVEDANTSFAKG